MANFTKMLLLIMAINIVFLWTGIVDVPGSSLLDVIMNPSLLSEDGFFWKFIIDTLLSVGGFAAIAAGTLLFKSDTMIFAGLTMVFLTYVRPLADLFAQINISTGPVIASLIVSPLVVLYLMTAIAWWRGRGT